MIRFQRGRESVQPMECKSMVYGWRIGDLLTVLNGRPLLTEYTKNNSKLCTVGLKKRQQVHNLPRDRAAMCRCVQLIKQGGFVQSPSQDEPDFFLAIRMIEDLRS